MKNNILQVERQQHALLKELTTLKESEEFIVKVFTECLAKISSANKVGNFSTEYSSFRLDKEGQYPALNSVKLGSLLRVMYPLLIVRVTYNEYHARNKSGRYQVYMNWDTQSRDGKEYL